MADKISGVKCCVKSCGRSYRTDKSVRLFSFPAADTALGQIWRAKCEITSDNKNKKIKVCDIHFESSDKLSKYLKRGAEPVYFLNNTASENPNLFEEAPILEENVGSSCSFCVKHAKTAKMYLKKLGTMYKNNRKLKNKITSLKIQLRKKSVLAQIDAVEDVSEQSKTFSKMLVRARQKTYDDASRTVAQNIYYVSRKSYLFLRNRLHLNLPHEDSINNWTPIKNLQPGFKNSGLAVFMKKMSTLSPVEKENAVMIFDEMAIRAELKYNQKLDIIDGFHDDGTVKTNKMGHQVSVFMVKGLFGNWAFIFNYFVSEKGLSGDCVSRMVFQNLEILSGNGVVVRAIVCDQASANRKAFTTFGVTPETPYFEFNGQKVFCIFDFPHLIKSLRNTLLKGNLVTPDGTVSFNVVRELWEREQSAPTKFCPKLTRQHIEPKNFEKMKVKFATQVFSKTVNAAINTVAAGNGFKKSSTSVAVSTANFIEKVDRVFDCMNSCTLYADNRYRSALQKNNDAHMYLRDFLQYVENVSLENKKTYVHFLKGMKISINAVAQLADEIFDDPNNNKFFLCTKALNQDKLENTFSLLRQRGGNNRFPSAAEVNGTIAKIMCCKLIQLTSSGNCESTGNESNSHLQIDAVTDDSIYDLPEIDAEYDEQNQAVMICTAQDTFENALSIDVLPSLRYFAGYVAHKILPKLGCDNCSKDVRKEEEIMTAPSELFVFYKNYTKTTDFGSLVAPSDEYFEISCKHVQIFADIFKTNPQANGIKALIVEKCLEATPEWFSGPCSPHKQQILDFLILVLLRKHCLWAVEKTRWTK